MDWWSIDIDGAIARLGAQQIIDQCYAGNAYLCTFIEGEGLGGVMTNISNPYLNLDSYATEGVDLEAAYDLELDGGATLGFRLFATKTDKIQTTVGSVTTDFVGVTGPSPFGQPELGLNGTVSYDRANWGVSLQTRYIDSGLYNKLWLEPGQPGYNPTAGTSVNDNTIDSVTYATLSGRYRLPMQTERSWELFLAINNLLDEEPPLAPDGAYPTNAAFFDQIGRAFRVGIRADF
jgi:hypothetical protein